MSILNTPNLCAFFVIVLAPNAYQDKVPEPTLSVQQRVNLLKFQLGQQIKHKQKNTDVVAPIDDDNEYQYVEMDDGPITPINEFDKRKKDGKYRLRQIVTTESAVASKTLPPVSNTKPAKRIRLDNTKHFKQPVETFYRRRLTEEMMQAPIPWLHCQNLFTPFVAGFKSDYDRTDFVGPNDPIVIRFMQLLRLNTTGHTKEEIYSILYQMSNVQLRLFTWNVPAIHKLISFLVNGKPHTFRNLVRGVKALLNSWHLDLSNTTNLLRQAKIFRPPCIQTSEYGGSTKTSSGLMYSKLTTPKTTCVPKPGAACDDESD